MNLESFFCFTAKIFGFLNPDEPKKTGNQFLESKTNPEWQNITKTATDCYHIPELY